MDIYTVSFFGHRCVEYEMKIENRLDKLLYSYLKVRE